MGKVSVSCSIFMPFITTLHIEKEPLQAVGKEVHQFLVTGRRHGISGHLTD